ncbi:MAG: M12 family metallo-peptidase [Dokdonella sp.]
MTCFRSVFFTVVLVLPISGWAATSFWSVAAAQNAHALSMAGVRAIEVAFDPAFDATSADQLELDLFGVTVIATRSRFEQRDNGWSWTGKVDGVAGHDVVLSQVDGQLAGRIATHTATYELRPRNKGASNLIELDPAAFPPCGGAVEAEGQPLLMDHAAPTVDLPDGIVAVGIDVMIVYTSQLLASLGGEPQVRAQAQAAVDAANTSFINSQMTARFELVAVLPTAIAEGPAVTALGTHLSSVRNDPQVAAQRTQYGADLVSMLVNDGLGSCGIGYVMRTVGAGFAANGYQVTASSCAVGNLSYAHEHGHNMGMEHDPPNGTTSADASYPWSFGHIVNGSYRTVMAYSSACTMGCTRRQYFSNPNVSYLGVPTGIVDTEDNHRTGNATAQIVAAFRANTNLIFADGFE